MPDVYPNQLVVRDPQFVRLSIVTMASAISKAISSFGSKIDLTVVESVHPKIANVHEAISYISKKLSGGDTLKVTENTNSFYAADGSAAPKSDNADSIKVMVGLHYTDYLAIKPVWKSTLYRMAICVGYGRVAADESNPGFLFMIGRPTGDLEWDSKEEFRMVEFTIEGGETYSGSTVGAFNTAIGSTAAGDVTLVDGSTTYTIPDLADASGTDDWENLQGSKIVDKATA